MLSKSSLLRISSLVLRDVSRNPFRMASRQQCNWVQLAGGSDVKEIRDRLWDSFLGDDARLRHNLPSSEGQSSQAQQSNAACHLDGPPDLTAHRVADSKVVGYIPLASNCERRTVYMNILGGVRVGLLLEDMDVVAAYSAYMHCSQHGNVGGSKSISIVTALVDRLDIHDQILLDRDIRLTGLVSWVGTSSMEVTVHVDQTCESDDSSALMDESDMSWKRLAEATFVMVGRNPKTNKAAPVNFLQLRTPEEIAMYQQGEERKALRQKMAKETLTKHPPNDIERKLIHELFLKSVRETSNAVQADLHLPAGAVWMDSTQMNSVRVCHPQHRNIHNKIFGGYLMRQAFELAWTAASVLTKSKPQFIAMDDIFFRCPVEIGDILEFKAQVVYTTGPYMQVSVSAMTLDSGSGTKRETTNLFQFTFSSPDSEPPEVLPKSYSESMRYVFGLRCHSKAMERISRYTPPEATSRL